MDELRWILLALGAVVLGLIYYFGRDRSKSIDQSPGHSTDQSAPEPKPSGPREPTFGAPGDDGIAVADGTKASDEKPSVDPAHFHRRDPEEIVALFVKPLRGDFGVNAIFHAAEKAGLTFGPMDIFHRLHEADDEAEPIFSVANMVKPGTFAAEDRQGQRCKGLSVFMTLPGPLPALDAWDVTLATSQRLAELLGGDLFDDAHSAVGRQRIAHIREQVREFDRREERRKRLSELR